MSAVGQWLMFNAILAEYSLSIPKRTSIWHHLRIASNGLANLRQVSGAKVAVASFVTDAAGDQCSDLSGRNLRDFKCPPLQKAVIQITIN